ncbi:MAG: succinate dehydrogenase [Pseudomonadota bacterium]
MLDFNLYMAQRLSALVMIPLTLGHIAVMVYAIDGGLTAGEILGRTQGSLGWFLFYGLFVVSVSVHAAIGLRVIAYEAFGMPRRHLPMLTFCIATVLLTMGLRAVWAVTYGVAA